jgi:serine/threonine protein kinase
MDAETPCCRPVCPSALLRSPNVAAEAVIDDVLGTLWTVDRGSTERVSLLAGRYELLEVIGAGSMAAVWRAFDERLHRHVAVKLLSEHLSEDPAFQQRFEREAQHIASLSHPNVVSVHDFGVDGQRAFIVMEYVEGQSLQRMLGAHGALAVSSTAALAADTLAALDDAHRHGIVHRDVKPGNILVTTDGVAKVADFGVAKSMSDSRELTAQGSFVGTATYASPEQLSGNSVGPASDLYSLGCVLYECLAGRPPFRADDVAKLVLQQRMADAEPIGSVRGDVPPGLAMAVMRSLEKDPGDRFASASAMRQAITPFVGDTRIDIADSVTPPRVVDGHGAGDLTVAPGGESTGTGAPPPSAHLDTVAHAGPRGTSGPTDRRSVRRAVVAIAVLLLGFAVASLVLTLGRGPTTPVGGSQMPPGDSLGPGQSLFSPNHQFRLTMDTDGNLVGWNTAASSPVWESGTAHAPGASAIMQGDGDFVVYPPGVSEPRTGQPTGALWTSETSRHPGAYLQVRNDGNIVIETPDGHQILWQTDTVAGPRGSDLSAGEVLRPGQYLESPNGRYRLVDDGTNGTLRLSPTGATGCALWLVPRRGYAASIAVMQQDGNFVLYRPGDLGADWETATAGDPGSSVVLQNDGVAVLSSPAGVALWQANVPPATLPHAGCPPGR